MSETGPKNIEDEKAEDGAQENGDRRFVLAGLESAKEAKYPWVEEAEKTANYIKTKTLETEEALRKLESDVEEGSDLHKQIEELAYAKWEERKKNGQPGDEKSDFISAIGELKEEYGLKQAFLSERWKRLDILSSKEEGSQDEELNKLAQEKAEGLKQEGKKVNNIECNDSARQEMIKKLGEELNIKEWGGKVKEQEKEPENLDASPEVEEPVTGLEKNAEMILKYRVELLQSFGKLLDNNPLLLNKDPNYSEHEAAIKESYLRMQKAVFKLTGESFDARVRVTAKAEIDRINAEIEKENKDKATEPGYKEKGKVRIISKKELFSPENRSRLELAEAQKVIGIGIRASWEKLTDREKGKFPNGPKEYARHLEAERVRLSKKGIDMPKETYFYLFSLGFEPQKAKKGFFNRKVSIPCRPGAFEDEKGNKIEGFLSLAPKDFKREMEAFHAAFVSKIVNNVGERLKDTYDKGRTRWMSRKVTVMNKVVNDVVREPVDVRAINEGERNTEAFEETIESSALNLLSDEQLTNKKEELLKEFHERMDKANEIVGTDCEPVCKALGLSPEKIKAFVKAAKGEGVAPDLDKKSKMFLTDILGNFNRIAEEYKPTLVLIDGLKTKRAEEKIRLAKIEADQKLEKALAEIKEKLAAA